MIETTQNGSLLRHQCSDCRGWCHEGEKIRHGKRCDSNEQPARPVVAETSAQSATRSQAAADQIRSTHLRGDAETRDVLALTRAGLLSVSDAMNCDD